MCSQSPQGRDRSRAARSGGPAGRGGQDCGTNPPVGLLTSFGQVGEGAVAGGRALYRTPRRRPVEHDFPHQLPTFETVERSSWSQVSLRFPASLAHN
jgi:hypothetical protein